MNIRVGLGFDVHPFGAERPLVLAGVAVDAPGLGGLAGHSDADVVAHAVADALLGAAGLGDLGSLFPAGEERYRDADSMVLLGSVADRIAGEGWSVVNVDVVIVAEQPPLAPHVAAMTTQLSETLSATAVSVKPKRAEGLGSIGRVEGIAAMAVALLQGAS
ncbi:MAG: 2-C-methyl-D-erythritol 2,4-cyclodiphosphate synthase [Acidimicrobiia bacterium]